MGIEDLMLKKCYIGNREVIKIYKGTDLIYDKSSGSSGIYERNGDLIIPAGTVCQLLDYGAETPDAIAEYILPSDIVISGTDGVVTLSDGQTVRYNASVEEVSATYVGTVEVVNHGSGGSQTSRTFNFTSSSPKSYGASYRSGLIQGSSFMTPISHFRITDMPDGYEAIFSVRMYDSYGNSVRFYLHDYGTTEPADWRDFYQVKDPVKISEDDIEVNSQYPGSGDVKYWVWTDRNLCVAEKNHYYSLYAIYTNLPSSSDLKYILTSDASLYSRKITTHYDEPLSVRLSGYKTSTRKSITASISHNDYPDKLGTTKVNEELKYYDVVPNE